MTFHFTYGIKSESNETIKTASERILYYISPYVLSYNCLLKNTEQIPAFNRSSTMCSCCVGLPKKQRRDLTVQKGICTVYTWLRYEYETLFDFF